MAAALQTTYPGICFSKWALSKNTRFEITNDSVHIFDPSDGYRYAFLGGSSKYSISITDSGTKKKPYKNITIKRLMLLCPLSGKPIIEPEMAHNIGLHIYEASPDRGMQFVQGFAYNCYQVEMWKRERSTFRLHPALYCKIVVDRHTMCNIYLVVPIEDGRNMQPNQMKALMDGLGNLDVVKIITSYYNQQSANDLNFNFHMADTPINLGALYHKRGLLDLFLRRQLKLGIVNDNLIGLYGYMGSILILEPNAYNHISPYGKKSVLKHMFATCQEMMNFKEMLVEKYVV